jgi:hypothetical protein
MEQCPELPSRVKSTTVLSWLAVFVLAIPIAFFTEQVVRAHPAGIFRMTPGDYLAQYLVPTNGLSTLAQTLLVALAIDAVAWFLITFGIYVAVRKALGPSQVK